jgi:hypothetical protein
MTTDETVQVAPAQRRPTPWSAWLALFLVLGPIWWIAVPFFVNKVIPLPEVGILVGPALSFVTAFVGLVIAFGCLDAATKQGYSKTVPRLAIAVFVFFTIMFAVLLVMFIASNGRMTL